MQYVGAIGNILIILEVFTVSLVRQNVNIYPQLFQCIFREIKGNVLHCGMQIFQEMLLNKCIVYSKLYIYFHTLGIEGLLGSFSRCFFFPGILGMKKGNHRNVSVPKQIIVVIMTSLPLK